MLVRSKFFSQLVEKIEKLELSLSQQHNKMLKIRCEMLKIIKSVKIIKLLEGIFLEFLEFFRGYIDQDFYEIVERPNTKWRIVGEK